MSHCSCLLPHVSSSRLHGFPCRANFQPDGQTMSWSHSLNKGTDAPWRLARALNLVQKGIVGLFLEQQHHLTALQTRGEPLPWLHPSILSSTAGQCRAQNELRASSTQQVNDHQSKCYLTRFILRVFLLHSHHTKHNKKNIILLLVFIAKPPFLPYFALLLLPCTPVMLWPAVPRGWMLRVLGGSSKCFYPHGAWRL